MQDINDKINNMHMGKLIHMLSHEMKRNHPIDKVIQDDLTIMQKHILKFILLETMHRDLYQKGHRRRIPDPQINGHGICAIDGEERISDKRK